MTGLNPWHQGVVCAFDLETTGIDVTDARIVTACFLEIHPGGKIRERNWLLNPGVDIPDGAAAIHGITTAKAQAEGQAPKEALLESVACLRAAWLAGWPVIGHNIGCYDLSLLEHELHRHGLGSIASHGGPGIVVDTLTVDRMIRPLWRGKRTLDACREAYGVRHDQAHDAREDAVTSARIAWRMCEGWPFDVQIELLELVERQERAHRAWAEDFGGWLRSKNRVDDVQRQWPYVPAVESARAVS